MELLLAFLVGTLFSVSLYFILHRHLFKVILGLILFGLATNLFLFVAGGISLGESAIIEADQVSATASQADPVPQALLLTAIVIGFGLQAFAIVIIRKVYQAFNTNNMDELHSTDKG